MAKFRLIILSFYRFNQNSLNTYLGTNYFKNRALILSFYYLDPNKL